MKQTVLGALLFCVFGLANPAFAAGNAVSTTMQVSFVIQEACTVHVADGSSAAPAVSCAREVPVQVSAATTGAAQAASSQTVASADGWQIYF